jgi:hypothetical protein
MSINRLVKFSLRKIIYEEILNYLKSTIIKVKVLKVSYIKYNLP